MSKKTYSDRFSIFIHKVLYFEKKILENFNISTNNLISVEAAKVLQYVAKLRAKVQILPENWKIVQTADKYYIVKNRQQNLTLPNLAHIGT